VRTIKTFQCTHILGASRGLLCDSSAVLLTEFPDKGWTKNSINRLLVKLRKFGTV